MVFRLQPRKQMPECDLSRPSVAQGKEISLQKVAHQNQISAFFDSQGLIHKEFVPTGQTVNSNFYKNVLDCLIKRINCVCSDKLVSSA